MADRVIAFAPATVANVGPCYDILGYPLEDVGDFVEIEKSLPSAQSLSWDDAISGQHAHELSTVPFHENTAFIAAREVVERYWKPARREFSLRLKLHKHLPIGSGLGSSAASAVAAVKAVVKSLELRLESHQIIECLAEAERATSGSAYPDNVVPSYFGGLQLVREKDNRLTHYRIEGGQSLISVVVCPRASVKTAESRTAVTSFVETRILQSDAAAPKILELVRKQSASAAALVLAYNRDDVATVGEIMGQNPLLEEARGPLIPHFHEVKRAAMDAGAYGCTISGAGPSMVAVTDSRDAALRIRDGMRAAFAPLHTHWVISGVNSRGASIIASTEKFTAKARASNNFYASE